MQSWQDEKAYLIQKIELLELTIGEMKDRETKIQRINQTLLHSLSANNETSTEGLRKVLNQQSAEISRLHQRLLDQRDDSIMSRMASEVHIPTNQKKSAVGISLQIDELSISKHSSRPKMSQQKIDTLSRLQERFKKPSAPNSASKNLNQTPNFHNNFLKAQLSKIPASTRNQQDNICGYLNFLNANPTSINSQLLRQQQDK